MRDDFDRCEAAVDDLDAVERIQTQPQHRTSIVKDIRLRLIGIADLRVRFLYAARP